MSELSCQSCPATFTGGWRHVNAARHRKSTGHATIAKPFLTNAQPWPVLDAAAMLFEMKRISNECRDLMFSRMPEMPLRIVSDPLTFSVPLSRETRIGWYAQYYGTPPTTEREKPPTPPEGGAGGS